MSTLPNREAFYVLFDINHDDHYADVGGENLPPCVIVVGPDSFGSNFAHRIRRLVCKMRIDDFGSSNPVGRVKIYFCGSTFAPLRKVT
ncbi:hypothetical protein C449_13592 [Halococcus saccharolyticus DSM 5350]|uniref:Uncharacterized protein n=1 Tax=Halococcus saccharolyticus DSM 5350 TaxID=1227455 RepID=M0MCY5_9EURY|nr:hypothetical protein C449_13592 [Halococcus saccharolyticus DSM 5350]